MLLPDRSFRSQGRNGTVRLSFCLMGDMMPSVVVVGAQWGDEAKAKVVDLLSEDADMVVRSQGGNNAGHTVVRGTEKYIFHLLPCGVLRPGVISVIGNGVVVDPKHFVSELEEMRERGLTITPETLALSDRAHVIMPWHRLLDTLSEQLKAGRKIGTTGRGIGPCYADKMARSGIRIVDLIDESTFRTMVTAALTEKNVLLEKLYEHEPLSADAVVTEYLGYAEALRPFVRDTQALLAEAVSADKRIVFEGAQGTLLDIDHGTYPFVTSSNTSSHAVCAGAGIPPKYVGKVIGVLKAYTTRVGAGPFPTGLTDELGDRLRENGDEFGATTGRPRGCGWLDTVACRYVARLTGFDAIALTKIDILSGIDPVRICTAYRTGGETVTTFPSSLPVLESAEPVYEDLPGWHEGLSDVREFAGLPQAAQAYVRRIEDVMSAPVEIISVGPERDQTIRTGREKR